MEGLASAGTPLTYRLDYSANDGKSWHLVAHGLSITSFEWDHLRFPGAESARLGVTANDGFHASQDDSPPITVASKAPSVSIIWPHHRSIHAQGRSVSLVALAEDQHRKALDGPSVRWLLDDHIELGAGAEQRLRDLRAPSPAGELVRAVPVGEHTVTVRVEDSGGRVAEDKVTITIDADSDGDGFTDEVERQAGTDPNDPLDHPEIGQQPQ